MRNYPFVICIFLPFIVGSDLCLAYQAPFVGDEGLEPSEARGELSVGPDGIAGAYRFGYRVSGLSVIYSVNRRWAGGFTAGGVGLSYRILEGYPFRIIGRFDSELGTSWVNGPSLGLRLIPGAAIEMGKEGGLCLTVGGGTALGAFVLPERGMTVDFVADTTLSFPIQGEWRGAIGGTLGWGSLLFQGEGERLWDVDTGLFVSMARWF